METERIRFEGLRAFDFEVNYAETRAWEEESHFDSHTHPWCEIYLNLTGDVSFMVESRVYPIGAGSVILTRPNEFHHCIYNSFSEVHRHFCIQFSSEGNEALLGRFFDRPLGEGNLIRLGGEGRREFEKICRALLSGAGGAAVRYGAFFRLLGILEEGIREGDRFGDPAGEAAPLPHDVRVALDYIQTHLSSPVTVREIAAEAHVSVNTLERHFLSSMKVTPSEFLKERRLAFARSLLREGKSVMEASEESGFSDCSHFIALFRKRFGVTPLRYKKARE